MRSSAIIFLLLFLVTNQSIAGFHDGNWLLSGLNDWEYCQNCAQTQQRMDDTRFANGMAVIGYIKGVSDTIESYAIKLNTPLPEYPGRVTAAQLAAIVKRYLADHPEQWTYDASNLVMAAIITTWPPAKK